MNQKKGLRNKKKTIAMLLVMAIFISILPESFTASAAEAIEKATQDTPALTLQFQTNNAWGGSIAAEIILKNESSKTIENWKITFNWKPVITSLWGSQYKTEEKSGLEGAAEPTNRYTIYPYEYNNTISPDSEIRIGLIASGEEAELAEPDLYEIEIGGENWVYDTKEGGLKKLEEAEEPELSEVPEVTTTPEVTEEPTKEPELSATPEVTEEPTKEPENSEEPEITATPEVTEEPTKKPEITATPEVTEEPTEEPEITSTPEVTEAPTTEPEITATPEVTEKPGITTVPEETITPTPEPEKTPDPTTTPESTKEPDYNLEDYEFTDDLIITSDKTLTKNISCANLYIKNGTLNTDGYKLTVRENTEQSGGKLTIENESKVTVKGKATLTAGILSFNDGRLQTEGDFTATGTGELQINTENSHAIIGGDCHLESRQRINSGLLEIKGNLNIPHKSWLKNGSNVKIKLSGSKTQTVTAEEETYLHSLDLTESAGVEFMQPIHAGTLVGMENITGEKATFAVSTISLTKDTELNYEVEIQSGEWKLGQNQLTITENLELTGGSLLAEEGTIKVQGNFHAAGGELNLRTEKAHAIIGRDCYIESGQRISGGLLEIKGNLDIPHKNWLKNGNNVNLKLSGKNIQSVTVEDGTNLHNLDLTESTGVEFHQPIHAGTLAGMENITGEKATFAVSAISLTRDTELEYDVEIQSGEWKLGQNKLTIAENLELTGGSLLAEEGTIIIWGDLYAAGGELNLRSEKAHVTVEGDCCIESGQRINGGLLEIKENLNIPHKNWLKNGNNVNIKLSGSRIQKVTTEEETYLHNLDITESKGVKFANTVNASTLIGIEKLTGSENTLNVSRAKPSTGGAVQNDLTVAGGSLDLDGQNLTINGTLTILGGSVAVSASGSALKVKENVEMEGGCLTISHGNVKIKGDCHIGGNSAISMNDYYAELYIDGDLTSSSTAESKMVLGDVYIKGNITQMEKAGSASLRIGSNLYLTGDKVQKVMMTHPERSPITYINLRQSAGVKFLSSMHIHNMDGWEWIRNDCLTLCGYTGTMERHSYFGGYLILVNSVMHMGYYSLTTRGLELYNTLMDIGHGQFRSEGNYGIYGKSYLEMTESSARLEVTGDLETYSEMSHRGHLTAGTIFLWGNLIQEGTNYSFAVSDDIQVQFMQRAEILGGKEQVVSQRDAEASVLWEKNYSCPNHGKVRFTALQEMEVTPSTLYHSFCDGVSDGILEAPQKVGSYAAWATLFTAMEYVGKGFGIAVSKDLVSGTVTTAVTAGSEILVAAIVALLAGYIWASWDEIEGKPNYLMYKLGKTAADCLIIAVISLLEKAVIDFVLTEELFEQIVIQTAGFIKSAWNAGEAATEQLLLCLRGAAGTIESLKGYLTESASALLTKLTETGAVTEEAAIRAAGYIMGQGGTEKITAAELKVILEYAGKTSDDALSALTKWIRSMPEYMAKLEPEALKYLKSRWSRFTENGIADDILKALEKECEGLAGDAVMGLDDVKAVVEKVGIKVSSETVNGFSKTVNAGRQSKHILGNNNYIEGRSIFDGTVDDAQKLVDEFAGTGEWIGQNKERVNFGKVIGKYVDPITKESVDTTVGMIHYSKKGTHIVPAQPIE